MGRLVDSKAFSEAAKQELSRLTFATSNILRYAMRYRLRTLLIVLALGPPLISWAWFHDDVSLPVLLVVAIAILIPVATVAAGLMIVLPAVAIVELVKAILRKAKSSD
jgi:hypothetical protein